MTATTIDLCRVCMDPEGTKLYVAATDEVTSTARGFADVSVVEVSTAGPAALKAPEDPRPNRKERRKRAALQRRKARKSR